MGVVPILFAEVLFAEEEIMNEFRRARDEIKEKVKKLIEEISNE
jgi:hypothetical protein